MLSAVESSGLGNWLVNVNKVWPAAKSGTAADTYRKLRLSLVDIYNHCLLERQRRHDLVAGFGLLPSALAVLFPDLPLTPCTSCCQSSGRSLSQSANNLSKPIVSTKKPRKSAYGRRRKRLYGLALQRKLAFKQKLSRAGQRFTPICKPSNSLGANNKELSLGDVNTSAKSEVVNGLSTRNDPLQLRSGSFLSLHNRGIVLRSPTVVPSSPVYLISEIDSTNLPKLSSSCSSTPSYCAAELISKVLSSNNTKCGYFSSANSDFKLAHNQEGSDVSLASMGINISNLAKSQNSNVRPQLQPSGLTSRTNLVENPDDQTPLVDQSQPQSHFTSSDSVDSGVGSCESFIAATPVTCSTGKLPPAIKDMSPGCSYRTSPLSARRQKSLRHPRKKHTQAADTVDQFAVSSLTCSHGNTLSADLDCSPHGSLYSSPRPLKVTDHSLSKFHYSMSEHCTQATHSSAFIGFDPSTYTSRVARSSPHSNLSRIAGGRDRCSFVASPSVTCSGHSTTFYTSAHTASKPIHCDLL
ncbi:unnamed protein product [Protopolystoma xenopodis]|uniref:Uncharacterized protein n=1 Tax=Protopolystoma xenopodis TaxID=117903 RepID=A0A448WBQ2_9PLAT|nr:unnamed protein product [Protopolystoma xenopodis]